MRGFGWVVCLAALSIVSRSARGDEFSDFRIPDHHGFDWQGDLGASGFRSSRDYDFGFHTEDRSIGGMASTALHWFRDSDPTFYQLFSRFGISGSERWAANDRQQPLQSLSLDQAGHEEFATIVSELRHYFTPVPIGASGRLDLDYRHQGNRSETSDRSTTFDSLGVWVRTSGNDVSQGGDFFAVAAAIGMPLGRVRDATGVQEARVLEVRLRATGALTRDLSPAARERLANLMYARSAYPSFRDRAPKSIWADIESVLRDDGALRDGRLDPYSVLRAAEPYLGPSGFSNADGLPTSPVRRRTGFVLVPEVSKQYTRIVRNIDGHQSFQLTQNDSLYSSFASDFSDTRVDEENTGAVDLRAEFHRPLDMRWQLDVTAIALAPLESDENWLDAGAQASLAWLIADRWWAYGYVSNQWHDDQRTAGPTARDRMYWWYGVRVSYYLEDRMTVDLEAADTQIWQRGQASEDFVPRFSRQGGFRLSLTRRFQGYFSAPGTLTTWNAGTP